MKKAVEVSERGEEENESRTTTTALLPDNDGAVAARRC